jgi:hypothetical protein
MKPSVSPKARYRTIAVANDHYRDSFNRIESYRNQRLLDDEGELSAGVATKTAMKGHTSRNRFRYPYPNHAGISWLRSHANQNFDVVMAVALVKYGVPGRDALREPVIDSYIDESSGRLVFRKWGRDWYADTDSKDTLYIDSKNILRLHKGTRRKQYVRAMTTLFRDGLVYFRVHGVVFQAETSKSQHRMTSHWDTGKLVYKPCITRCAENGYRSQNGFEYSQPIADKRFEGRLIPARWIRTTNAKTLKALGPIVDRLVNCATSNSFDRAKHIIQ